MLSADIRLFCLRVLFIKLLLLRSRFPQFHEVIVLSVLILPHLKMSAYSFFPTQPMTLYCSGISERWSR